MKRSKLNTDFGKALKLYSNLIEKGAKISVGAYSWYYPNNTILIEVWAPGEK